MHVSVRVHCGHVLCVCGHVCGACGVGVSVRTRVCGACGWVSLGVRVCRVCTQRVSVPHLLLSRILRPVAKLRGLQPLCPQGRVLL